MTVIAVADAGPLIHLAEIDSLELLTALDRLYIPETVYDELDAGGVPPGIQSLPHECIGTNEMDPTDSELDAGETAALAIAIQQDAILLTDDLAARDAAKERGVEVHGSVGIIVFADSHGQLDKDEAVRKMRALQRETSLFITGAVVERGIDMLDGAE